MIGIMPQNLIFLVVRFLSAGFYHCLNHIKTLKKWYVFATAKLLLLFGNFHHKNKELNLYMYFENPFPDNCEFAVAQNNLELTGVHPLEVEIGNSFLSSNRRSEFFSGRRCAHLAMVAAGYPNLPVLRAYDRSPIWPLTIVGSITHTSVLASVIIKKHHSRVMGLGIDLEDLSRDIRTNINSHILTSWEMSQWTDASAVVSREVKIIFSIKEAIFKCFYPINEVYLGFHDAEITELSDDRFQASLLKNPFSHPTQTPLLLQGKLAFFESHVLAALYITQDQIFI